MEVSDFIMKIVFYGSGNMANAIFTGIVNSKSIEPENIYLTNKSNQEALKVIMKL